MEDRLLGLQGGKFPLGIVVLTKGVHDLMVEDEEFEKFIVESLTRHARGDWGDVEPEDWKENEESVSRELRLLSAYEAIFIDPSNGEVSGGKIWIITEADRSVTTVLFPEEY